jgi:hypothetical protein
LIAAAGNKSENSRNKHCQADSTAVFLRKYQLTVGFGMDTVDAVEVTHSSFRCVDFVELIVETLRPLECCVVHSLIVARAKPPNVQAIQELVTAFKLLWKWRRKG